MQALDLVAVLITLCALFAYVNFRFLGLPTTIGVMLMALAVSLGLIGIGEFNPEVRTQTAAWIATLDFDDLVMQGLLGFLLFAGALHVDMTKLAAQGPVIGSLATVGVLLSTTIVGGGAYLLFGALGLDVPLLPSLVFGALISPTDPIAVLAIFKQTATPPVLQTKIVGESMFNDGVGVVVFLLLSGIATGRAEASPGAIASLFAIEAVGGIALGFALGYVSFRMLATVDNYQVEVLITLALVMGGYTLARALHTSGPLAMVVAGLMIGNRGRAVAMSERTRQHLDTFWELMDEILNAALFALVGFELLILDLEARYLLAGLLAIPLVLLARLTAVAVPVTILRRTRHFEDHTIKVLTWGGLRGGISIALVLSLPEGAVREALLVVTYVVVAFSIAVQGLSIGPLLRRLFPETP